MDDQTRRSWMITITQAAVGLSIAARANSDGAPVGYPPGVYEPSTNHLSHALMSAESYHPIPSGCPTDYVRPKGGSFEPVFFSGPELRTVHRIVQLLLGTTPEEAAVSKEIADWIDLRLSGAYAVLEARERLDPAYRALESAYLGGAQEDRAASVDAVRTCRQGLLWILSKAQSQHAADFLSLTADQQIAILDSISDDRADKEAQNAGTGLFSFLKAETIRGFYTSRAGLKELDFKGNAFYARSPGCRS